MNKKQIKVNIEKKEKEITKQRSEIDNLKQIISIMENEISFNEYTLNEMKSMLKESV